MRTKPIAASIKTVIINGPVATIEYQPGNGTRYKVLIINNTKTEEGCYTVALMTEGHGTCMNVMPAAGFLAAGYVGEKLKVGRGDAVILAELIAHLTGRRADDASNEESYK